jgi:murein DD-endopeptidase MepM/ murein hydrolase activator NlpD
MVRTPPKKIRRISSNDIRRPAADAAAQPDAAPDAPDAPAAEPPAAPGRLAPVRDTGIALNSRAARTQRARQRSQRQATAVGVLALAGLLLLAIGWRATSDHRASVTTPGGTSAASLVTAAIGGSLGTSTASAASTIPATSAEPRPTPYFARYKSLKLRLPVPLKALTEVGFHQASYGYALPMTTQLPDANLAKTAKRHGTGRNISKQSTGVNDWLIGSVVRMWRARPGKPDTAADVGAKAGTVILAPVSGTVIKFKRYLLYGKYIDYEIHIQPAGHPKLDVVLIHITGIVCHVGDKVVAGVTPLAHIRKFSDKFHDQLADYSKGAGDHVHIAVNDTTDPTYKGLEGAIDPRTWHQGDATPAAPTTGTRIPSGYE